jgi:hypothetical protein
MYLKHGRCTHALNEFAVVISKDYEFNGAGTRD